MQGTSYFVGARVTVYPAEKLYIDASSGKVRLGTRFVYTNDGEATYNALVLSESVSFPLGGTTYQMWAESRGHFGVAQNKAGTEVMVLQDAVDAVPFIIPGKQLITHETFFAARENRGENDPWKNYLTRDQFITLLQTAYDQGNKEIEFKLWANIRQISGFDSGKQSMHTVNCAISLDKGLIERIKIEGWSARSCQNIKGT